MFNSCVSKLLNIKRSHNRSLEVLKNSSSSYETNFRGNDKEKH